MMFICEDELFDAISRNKPRYDGILEAIKEEARHYYNYVDFDLDWWL